MSEAVRTRTLSFRLRKPPFSPQLTHSMTREFQTSIKLFLALVEVQRHMFGKAIYVFSGRLPKKAQTRMEYVARDPRTKKFICVLKSLLFELTTAGC